jgi:predicted nucleotidyltransferase
MAELLHYETVHADVPATRHLKRHLAIKPISGIIEPIMGISSSPAEQISLSDALFPKVRQRVLAVLFGTPDRSYYANEVIALAQSGTGAVQRELADLSAAGLLTVSRQGNQKHYQANANAPVFAELRSLVFKTMGLADVLCTSLAPLAGQIDAAFIYGSVARQQDTAHSDVDVMIVSDMLGYGDVFGALEGATTSLGRKVNPTLYTSADWRKRLQKDSVFVTRVWQQPKIWLIGSEESLHAPGA